MVLPPGSTLWRRLVRAVTGVPDRFKHAARRNAATELVRATTPLQSILVVCHGNLCRSPYAAAALRVRAESAGIAAGIDSAGFFGANRSSPTHALAAAAARGIDLSTHRSRTVDRALLDSADLIVVMDPRQADAVVARYAAKRRVVVLGDLDPSPITIREIADPVGQPRAEFDECYDRIDRCLDHLVRLLEAGKRKAGSAS